MYAPDKEKNFKELKALKNWLLGILKSISHECKLCLFNMQ